MIAARNLLLCSIASALLFFAASATADVYKWVDKDGKTHYTDQPPIGSEAKKLKRKTTEPPAAAPNAGTKPANSTADQELEYRKRKAEKEEIEKKQKSEAEMAQKNKEYCNGLKGELRSHSDGTRLYRYNDKGERVFYDEKEHADSKRELEGRIAKECK